MNSIRFGPTQINKTVLFLRDFLNRHRRLPAFVVVALGVAFNLPLNSFVSIQHLGNEFKMLDGSWQLEMPARLHWGEWAGRDFIFTYGPLYQLTHALGWLVSSRDVASLMRFQGVLDSLLMMLLLWATLRTSAAPLGWRALFYLFWAGAYSFFPSEATGLKPLGAACLVALCASALQRSDVAAAFFRKRTALLFAVAAPLALLYSFDMGVYVLLSLLLTGFVLWATTVRLACLGAVDLRRQSLVLVASALAGSAIFYGLLMLSPAWQSYITNSMSLAKSYVFMLPTTLPDGGLVALGAAALISVATIGATGWRLRQSLQNAQTIEMRTLAALGFSCFALLSTRSGLTRGDNAHAFSAVVPCLFLCFGLGICGCHTAKKWFAPWASCSFLCLVTLVAALQHERVADAARQRLSAFAQISFRPARLQIENTELQGAVALARTVKASSLLVWPFETTVNVIEGKRNPVFTLQLYASVTPQLEKETVSRLRQTPDLPVLLIRHATGSIDHVENLTRNPLVFRYLLDNYETTSQQNAIAVLLKPRLANHRLRWREQPTSIAPKSVQLAHQKSVSLQCPSSTEALRSTDLLLLQMKATKTRLSLWGKPGQYVAVFQLSDGRKILQAFLLPLDGESHRILLSPTVITAPAFLGLFATYPLRSSPVAITKIDLVWQRLDRLSVMPQEIAVERVFKLQPQDAARTSKAGDN